MTMDILDEGGNPGCRP